MSREHPDYRLNLELLNMRFPNYDVLTPMEAAQVLGYTDSRTVKKYLGKNFTPDGKLSKTALARYMCGS